MVRPIAAFILLAVLVAAACAAAVAQEAPPAAPASADDARITYVGRVVDTRGAPVAGANVWADNGGSYQVIKMETAPAWRSMVPDPDRVADVGPYTVRAADATGPDGRFRVAGVRPPVGKGWVVASHPAHAAGRRDATGIAARARVVDVGDVVLPRGRTLRVRVAVADGTPVADAWVAARLASPVGGAGNWWSHDTPGEMRCARTDDAGVAVLTGLRAARYAVAAFTETRAPVEAEMEATDGDGPTLDLALRGGATLRIEVRGRRSGSVLAGARVVVDRTVEGGMSWPGPPPYARLRTGGDGVATAVGLPDDVAEFAVRVTPPDFAADSVHHPGAFSVGRVMKPGETARFALDEPVALSIPVVDARTGEPVAEPRVVARAVWDAYDRSGGSPIELKGAVEGAGVVLRDLRPGPWTFDVWAADHHPHRVGPVQVGASPAALDPAHIDPVHIDPVHIETVRLEPATGAVAGRVVERATGRPVAGATVATYEWLAAFNDGQRAAATTSSDGAFRVVGVLGAGAPLRIEVTAPGYLFALREWTEATRVSEVGAIEVVRAATVRGRLTDRDGRPLAQQEVELVSPGGRGVSKSDGRSATTDADGRFVFDGLRPGDYVLVGQRESSTIRLGEGATVTRDLMR